MEEYFHLMDIVEYLVKDGYCIDFSEFERVIKDVNSNKSKILLPTDFKIDSIFKCKESVSDSCYTFVFAISSNRYKFKGILINALEQNHPISIRNKLLALSNMLLQKINKRKNNNPSK